MPDYGGGMIFPRRYTIDPPEPPEHDEDEYPPCETCGDPIDFCQGHGPIAEWALTGRSDVPVDVEDFLPPGSSTADDDLPF